MGWPPIAQFARQIRTGTAPRSCSVRLTADLPRPVARTGLPFETVALPRMRPTAGRGLAGEMIWILEFALAAGLTALVIPPAVWVATVLIPITLLLPPALGISRYADPRESDPGRGGAERDGQSRIRRQEGKDS